MSIHRFLPLLLLPLGFAIPLAAQEIGAAGRAALDMVLVNHKQNVQITGRTTFGEDSIQFESADIVFDLSFKDIKSVEYKGTRDEFLTLTLESTSKFIEQYPFLCLAKTDAYQRRVPILVMSLAAQEPVDKSVRVAKPLQALIARRNEAAERAMIAPSGVTTEEQAAHPFLGKTVHVVIGRTTNPQMGYMGGGSEIVSGLLTFFTEHLEFNSRDVNFALPYSNIEVVQCAGARDTFLTVRLNPREEFLKLYGGYRYVENYSFAAAVRFSLDMSEPVAPAYRAAQDFQQYMDVVRTRSEKAMIGAVGRGRLAPSGDHDAPVAAEPRQANVLLALEAFYLEKRPGAFMGSPGKPGEFVVRDDGVGFRFSEPGKLSPERQQAAANSRVFIPMDSLETAYVRDQKIIPGMTRTLFFVILRPKPAAPNYERLRPLLSPDGDLIFTVRAVNYYSQVKTLLARFDAASF